MFHASNKTIVVFAAGLAGALGLGSGLARVHAEGVPKAQPLWYSGTVADASGKPIETKDYDITLGLYERQEQQVGEMATCAVSTKATRVVNGRFRIDVSECAAVLQKNPDLYAELKIDNGKPFERAKVGAVPFALEAQHAVNGVPAGGIVMFAGPCPAGWTEYQALRGRFPRGEATGNTQSLDTGGADDAVVVTHSHAASAVIAGGEHAHSFATTTSSDGLHSHEQYVSAGPSVVSTYTCIQGNTRRDWVNNETAVCSFPQGINTGNAGAHAHSVSGTTQTQGHSHSATVMVSPSGESGVGKNVPRFQEVVFCVRQ